MNKKRDEFSSATKTLIAKRSGYICSNPACHCLTLTPSGEKTSCIGVAAHIYAAAPGGPRYNKSMTKEERKSLKNGIWLCQTCSNFIDKDEIKYNAELLTKWKNDMEELIAYNFNKPIMLEKENKLDLVFELLKFPEKWAPLADKDWGYYYSDNPAYSLIVEDDYDCNNLEYYSWLQTNESTFYGKLYINYYSNCIFTTQTVCLDSGRCLTVVPETDYININNDVFPYKYFIKDSNLMILRNFFEQKDGKDNEEYSYALRKFDEVITLFDDFDDQQNFENYFKDKIQISDIEHITKKYNYCGYTDLEKKFNKLSIALGIYIKDKYISLKDDNITE